MLMRLLTPPLPESARCSRRLLMPRVLKRGGYLLRRVLSAQKSQRKHCCCCFCKVNMFAVDFHPDLTLFLVFGECSQFFRICFVLIKHQIFVLWTGGQSRDPRILFCNSLLFLNCFSPLPIFRLNS